MGVSISREQRRENISRRLRERIAEGMADEVRSLLHNGLTPEDLIYYGLEYKYVTLFVTGSIDADTMTKQLEIAIHQFAKRQMTWFSGMERRGVPIQWLDYTLQETEKIKKIKQLWLAKEATNPKEE